MSKKGKLKPIKHYINDKEELINQVFSSLPQKQLKKMIPSSLADMSIDELKAECLVQLLKMSNKRIIRILDGLKNYRSESEELDENCKANGTEIVESGSEKNLKCKMEKERKEDIENYNVSSEEKHSVKRKHKEKKHKEKKKKRKRNNDEELNNAESKGKNLLELLELEMRAKAIRSLIKKEEELEKMAEVNTDSLINKLSQEGEELCKGKKMRDEDKNKRKKEIKDRKHHTESKESDTLNNIKRSRQNIDKDIKRIELESKKDQNIKEENEKDQNIIENEKLNCDWSIDDDKLIYEDDEYDSDDKIENEISKEVEKTEENSTSSWAERWLQSKDVKKVVATSKMLTVVRNKMKINKSSKSSNNSTNASQSLVLEGSVKEYDTLVQMNEAVLADAKMRAALNKQLNT